MVGQVTEKVTVGDERRGIRALAPGGPGEAVGEQVDHLDRLTLLVDALRMERHLRVLHYMWRLARRPAGAMRT
jgi:hypothetical protein